MSQICRNRNQLKEYVCPSICIGEGLVLSSQISQVPAALLLHPGLSASAKVVWMTSQLGAYGSPWALSVLASTAGLSRPTVYRALAELTAAGWELARTADAPTVPIPHTLLTNGGLGTQARLIYGTLLLTPGFHHPFGQFTYEELGVLAHTSTHTAIRAVAELEQAEWVKTERKNRKAKVKFELTFPGLEQSLNEVASAERRLANNPFLGENLMREYLSLLVDCDEYIDNGSPSALRNPRTGELLQLDRFYPPRVGLEFNGPQHDRATEKFTEEQSARQRERDMIKIGLCVTHGISLVIVRPEDLTLTMMRQKVEGLLPLKDTSQHALLIDFLERKSEDYRRWAASI